MEEKDKLIKQLADDYSAVLKEAKSMGCNEIKALYNIPLKNRELIVQTLEKQIPKKVKNSGERIPFEWYCPNCGELLCDDGYKDTDIKYCDNCGQMIDWSDEI